MAKKDNDKAITFYEVSRKWIESKRGANLKDSTIAQYEWMLSEKYIKRIASKKMNYFLKKDFFEKYEAELIEEGLANTTIKNYCVLINSVIRYYRGDNERSYRTTCDKDNSAQEITSYDIKKILETVKMDGIPDYKKLGVMIVLYSGVSLGELCGLKWGDIDTYEDMIVVRRALMRTADLEDNKRTKMEMTSVSERRIPIHGKLKNPLMLCMAEGNKEDYILSNSARPMSQRSYQMALNEMFSQFEKSYTVSNLRDFFISSSLKCGMSLGVLAEITGVTVIHIVKKYGHLIKVTEGAKRLEMKKLTF